MFTVSGHWPNRHLVRWATSKNIVSRYHLSPRICIIYFSLSGQSRGLINLLASGIRIQGVEVVIEQIRTPQRIGFPFNSVFQTLKIMLTTFFRKRIPILELSSNCYESYDLFILAGPTWSYNPSGPVLSLLDCYGEKLFAGKQVVPLISCRGYYRMHERLLTRQLQKCGAQVGESIIFSHPVSEPWSTIGVFLKSAGYQPERISFLTKHYPHFGHTVEQLYQVRSCGQMLAENLLEQKLAYDGDEVLIAQ